MANKTKTQQRKDNDGRVRLCNFSIGKKAAVTVEPAFKRLVDEYGGGIAALCKAVIDADRALTKSKEDVR